MDIPQKIDEKYAPRRFLECSIYSCLLSHLQDFGLNPSSLVVKISGGEVKIQIAKCDSEKIVEVCSQCYILSLLKIQWVIEIKEK
jgi:hypothetical protein